jgi:PhnB protein
MAHPVRPVPEGFHTVTSYLIVEGAARLIEFLQRAFGAEELHRAPGPDGTVLHAQLRIGDSMIELSDARDPWPARPGTLHLYVEDADALYRRALQAGATSLYEPSDKFYGDREAGVVDPSGNHWFLATHREDVSQEEMERRMAAMAGAPS